MGYQVVEADNGYVGLEQLKRETPDLLIVDFAMPGINGAEDYVRLAAWLQSTSVVRGVRPLRATPNSLELELDLLTGLAGFRRVLDGSVLVESGANLDGLPPEFQLR